MVAARAAAAERLAKLCQRLALANARVAQATSVYERERAASAVSTWTYCTLELPALCLHLKAVEANRAQRLAECQWRALDALSELPNAEMALVEERTRQAATLKGERWLDGVAL